MLARRSLHPLLALALLVLFSIPCSHAIAQDSPPSVSELRRENEQLRIRIDELETQLARSQEAISKLLEQVSELNTRVAALQEELRRRTSGPDGQPRSPDEPAVEEPAQSYAQLPESEPYAAPESMFRSVVDSYAKAFGEVETPFESSDARNRYLRDVDVWSKSLRRSLRSQVEWTIEVRNISQAEREALFIEYRVVNSETRLPYSDRYFKIPIPARFERRILQSRDTRFWQMRGVVSASLNINRDRESVGFFDVRPFVGPFVEFDLEVALSSVMPAPEPAEPQSSEDGGPSDSSK
jgi:uncharacterized coiled-coil protein SlyX